MLGPLVYKYDCCIVIELVVCFAIKREVSELLIRASATFGGLSGIGIICRDLSRTDDEMATTEALRTQLDTLRLEKQRLEVENVRLREAHPEEAARIDSEDETSRWQAEAARFESESESRAAEAAQLRKLYEQLLRDMQGTQEEQAEVLQREAQHETKIAELTEQLERQTATAQEMERDCSQLRDEMLRASERVELECHRAVAEERKKWEAREERALQQQLEVQHLRRWEAVQARSRVERDDVDDHSERGDSYTEKTPTKESAAASDGSQGPVELELGESNAREAKGTVSPRCENPSLVSPPTQTGNTDLQPRPTPPAPLADVTTAYSALLAHQLPLQKYSGEPTASDGETFRDWKDQFELVAGACKWDSQAKLVNLVTRLRGQAYAFYRSCTPPQRSSYDALIGELSKRFTPVRIQAIESSLFHERKQKPSETVDDYAQDLRVLFKRAYPLAQQGTQEAETMGKSVLAYQFVSGLRPEIKAKVAGHEGDFEKLLTKARFEEVKLRDIGEPFSRSGPRPFATPSITRPRVGFTPFRDSRGSSGTEFRDSSGGSQGRPPNRCFHCGGSGHFARMCPRRGKARLSETPGKSQGSNRPTVAQIGPNDPTQNSLNQGPERIAELRRQLQEAELNEALTKASATMHVIRSTGTSKSAQLGPTPTANVELEGSVTKALLDTGSPVTIVSLQFLLEALARQRPKSQSAEDWRAAVEERLEPSTVTLQNYGGQRLGIVRQIKVGITRPGCSVEAVVQVHQDAPTDLLIGTDLLPQLGFIFLQTELEGEDIDLLSMEKSSTFAADFTPDRDQVEQRNQTGYSDPSGEVCLIQATRLPARHMKMVRAKVCGYTEKSLALFEPEIESLQEKGLSMTEATTQPDVDNCVTLIIQNDSHEPTYLRKDQVLGRVYPASLQMTTEEVVPHPDEYHEPVPLLNLLQSASQTALLENSMVPLSEEPDIGRHTRLLADLCLNQSSITEEQHRLLESLVLEYSDVFALTSSELGSTDLVTHSIATGSHSPIRQPVRRTPFALRDTVDKLVQEMLEQDVIRPSQSPWASPIVLVKKKDNTMRFCVDYRRLNSITKLDVFPLPRIDDTLDLLSKTKYFTTLDLASGYWQVRMSEDAREKTAFTTYSGLYEFNVMPFGLCNAPATFQRLMEIVLAGLTRRSCMVYIDDILVFSETFEEHLAHLRQVLDRLRQVGLRLKPKKCDFVKDKVRYLGHIVSARGIEVDPVKTEAVHNFPRPRLEDSPVLPRTRLILPSIRPQFREGCGALAYSHSQGHSIHLD